MKTQETMTDREAKAIASTAMAEFARSVCSIRFSEYKKVRKPFIHWIKDVIRRGDTSRYDIIPVMLHPGDEGYDSALYETGFIISHNDQSEARS